MKRKFTRHVAAQELHAKNQKCVVQQMGIPIPWMILSLVVIALASCGGEKRDTSPTVVEDPRAYAIESLQTMDLNTWWQAYRNLDPTLLGRIVDEVAADRSDGLPTDAQQLDIFIRQRIATSYKLYMYDTVEGKAFILAEAEARFANPPMAVWDKNGNYALLDFYSLPGEWKSTTRISEGLADPPAISTQPYLNPDVLAENLQRLVAAYPDVRAYQIRYQYHHGSDLKKILMQFVPDGQIVYKEFGEVFFTRDPVAWDDLLNGRIDLADLDWDAPMEDYSAPPMAYPPEEPLPSVQ